MSGGCVAWPRILSAGAHRSHTPHWLSAFAPLTSCCSESGYRPGQAPALGGVLRPEASAVHTGWQLAHPQ